MTLRVIELFAGIGAQTTALKRLGIEHEVVAICEIDKHAIKSYTALHGETPNLGDITKVERLPDCDLLTYSFPCLRGDMNITTDKGDKKIKDVVVGDRVLTLSGGYNSVIATKEAGIKGTLEVRTAIGTVVCTHDHMILTRYKMMGKSKRKFTQPYWCPAAALTKDNYVCMPINKTEKLPVWDGIISVWGDRYRCEYKNKIKPMLADKRFWRMCGRWLGDGWTVGGTRAVICCGLCEVDEVKNELDGLYHYNLCEEGPIFKFHIPDLELTHFLNQFGKGAKNKIIPQFVLDLPVELLKEFIEGYISADGSISDGIIRISTISENISRSLVQAVAKAYGRPARVYFSNYREDGVIEGRTVHTNPIYQIVWKVQKGTQDEQFVEDGLVWTAIKSVNTLNPTQTFDISVDDDPTFVANNILVHNCTDLSMAGNRQGMARGSDTRSGLLWEVERLLIDMRERESLPDVLLMENVDAILFKANKPAFDEWIRSLSEMGYTSSYKVLNSTQFDVPQNRKRCFMISMRNGRLFDFPDPIPQTRRLIDLLETDADEKYCVPEKTVQSLVAHRKRHEEKGNGFGFKVTDPCSQSASSITSRTGHGNETYVPSVIGEVEAPYDMARRVYDPLGVAPTVNTRGDASRCTKIAVYPCLTPERSEKQQNGRRFKNDGEPSFTLTAMDRHGIAIAQNIEKGYIEGYAGDGIDLIAPTAKNRRGRCQPERSYTLQAGNGAGVIVGEERELRIRRLTPRECWRLQDFSDEQFDKASKVVSEAQLYKQAGNSITVRVLMEIFRKVYQEEGARVPTLFSFGSASASEPQSQPLSRE